MSKKVLIVDDSESIVDALGFLLEIKTGFIVLNSKATTTVDEALGFINNFCPDIILLDHELSLGGDEGLEIAEKIIDKIKNNIIKVLSTSILVSSSLKLSGRYRDYGVKHFSGKNIVDIMKCVNNHCDCL